MAKLYAEYSVLVSRWHTHTGDGLEKGPLRIFHSRAQYEAVSQENGWDDLKKSFNTSWCPPPKPVRVHIEQKAGRKFFAYGGELPLSKVLFPADRIEELLAVTNM